ncbi:MAG: MBL fold metallo-hydrolase [Candidatus Tectomicrobia bacterium]|uniref:MBL fold metallo-hydrolase n=1 Tax=Tectimicrobiota bacterium TaxID=2528274 RepID=A0A932GS00_UNCTE|nr:MBL fold metallo-hydrolase [Candidatus Tectomicrobia bacterium]
MIVRTFEVGSDQNNTYLLACEKTRIGAIVDPYLEVPGILQAARDEKIRIEYVLLTHTHRDHCLGVPEVVMATGATVYVHEKEAERVPGEGKLLTLKQGSRVQVGEIILEVFHTPGHTPGGVTYYQPDSAGAITGDVLFVGYCGRADLPGSDPRALWRSLQALAKLPDHTVIYPGHNYGKTPGSTVGYEKSFNPYYQCRTEEEFVQLRLYGKVE